MDAVGTADTLRKRCRRWAQTGVWKGLFEAVQEPDMDWVMPQLNGRAGPRPSGGQPKKSRAGDEAPSCSRGGLTTKGHALADALGNPLLPDAWPGPASGLPPGR